MYTNLKPNSALNVSSNHMYDLNLLQEEKKRDDIRMQSMKRQAFKVVSYTQEWRVFFFST